MHPIPIIVKFSTILCRKTSGVKKIRGSRTHIDPRGLKDYPERVKQHYKIPCIDGYGRIIMSLLERNLTLKGLKGERTVSALFDSGASYSCIRREVADEIGLLEPLEEPMTFETADKDSEVVAEFVVRLSFFFSDSERRFTDEFIVLDNLSEDLIIGAATLRKWKIRLDFDADEVTYERKMHRLRI